MECRSMEGVCRAVEDLLDGGDESLKTSNMEASEATLTSYIDMFYHDTGAAQTHSKWLGPILVIPKHIATAERVVV